MLISLSRQNIFLSSAFADNLIAEFQQSYARDFDKEDKAEAATLKRYYDHQVPFQAFDKKIEGNCVLAFFAESLKEYNNGVIEAFLKFFKLLHIKKLFFIDFLNKPLADFPFQNYHKHNVLKRLAKGDLKQGGILIDEGDTEQVLPLFFFARNNYGPQVFIISEESEVHFSMHICKDGNFHCNYPTADETVIHDAAVKSGLAIGDVSLCWDYYPNGLPYLK